MKIVFLTGAGVSVESGLTTFRGNNGLWENYKVMDVASLNGWKKNKELVLEFYNKRRQNLDLVYPNETHHLIVNLEKHFDVNIITTNVDDLHERAGSKNILHLHGELRKMCSSMNKELTLPYDNDIKIGDKHPDGSQLRPYIVFFQEDVPKIGEATKIVGEADIFVVVGTSLQVYPAAGLIDYVKDEAELYYIDPNPSLNEVTWNIRNRVKVIEKVGSEGMKELVEILSEKK